MEVKYDLKQIFTLDSMHDQRVNTIEIKENLLIFHYNELQFYETNYKKDCKYYLEHKDFNSCDIAFVNGQDALVEVRNEKRMHIKANVYCINEFIKLTNKRNYIIETMYFYCGFEEVIIKGTLVNKKGYYCKKCIFRIPTTEMIYQWEKKYT
jgi:hypothetical protein